MAEPFELGDGRVLSGCSIGVAWAERGMSDPTELLRQADLALYRAKAESRGSYCLFEQAMDATMKTRRAIDADLRDALAADALDLFYQPQDDGRASLSASKRSCDGIIRSAAMCRPGCSCRSPSRVA